MGLWWKKPSSRDTSLVFVYFTARGGWRGWWEEKAWIRGVGWVDNLEWNLDFIKTSERNIEVCMYGLIQTRESQGWIWGLEPLNKNYEAFSDFQTSLA